MSGSCTGRRRALRARRGDLGQASVELVAVLPLLVLLATAALHVLAAGLARELAGHAAEAGAVAIVQERDAREAVRASVPGWSRRGLEVEVRGPRVRVVLQAPSLGGHLGELLAGRAEAVAGPAREAGP